MKSTACKSSSHETAALGGAAGNGAAGRLGAPAVERIVERRGPLSAAARSRLHRARARDAQIVPVQVMVPARFRDLILMVGRILREAERPDAPGAGPRRARFRKARLALVRRLLILKTETLKE